MSDIPGSSLQEVGNTLAHEIDRILATFVLHLREDPEIPQTRGLGNANLVDHLSTLLGDISRSLIGAGDSRLEPERLLRDGSKIQRTIAELHGAQRAHYGWREGTLDRELDILRKEVERVLRGESETSVADGIKVAVGLLQQAKRCSAHALRNANLGTTG